MVAVEVSDLEPVRVNRPLWVVQVHDELEEENNGIRGGFGTQMEVGVDMPLYRYAPRSGKGRRSVWRALSGGIRRRSFDDLVSVLHKPITLFRRRHRRVCYQHIASLFLGLSSTSFGA